MTNNDLGREAFEEAVVNMTVVSSPYHREYIFYLHLLSKCKIRYNSTLEACAGVSFQNDHYVLHLNPNEVIAEVLDPITNTKTLIQGFTKSMPLAQ